MTDRNQLKSKYAQTVDDAIALLDTMSADFWEQKEQQSKETEQLVFQFKNLLKRAAVLKQELLALKREELKNAPQSDLDYLAELEQKWADEATLLGAIFLDKDSPFTSEWAKIDENWLDKISGLKEALPLRSKGFVKDLQTYLLRSKVDFDYN